MTRWTLPREIGAVLVAKLLLLAALFVLFFAQPVATDAAQTAQRIVGGGR